MLILTPLICQKISESSKSLHSINLIFSLDYNNTEVGVEYTTEIVWKTLFKSRNVLLLEIVTKHYLSVSIN